MLRLLLAFPGGATFASLGVENDLEKLAILFENERAIPFRLACGSGKALSLLGSERREVDRHAPRVIFRMSLRTELVGGLLQTSSTGWALSQATSVSLSELIELITEGSASEPGILRQELTFSRSEILQSTAA